MGKACKTSIARSMGYLSTPSQEEVQHRQPVSIMGPMTGAMRSYHQGGMSSKDIWKRQRDHAECVRREFRL